MDEKQNNSNIQATAERVRAAVVLEAETGAGMDGQTTFMARVLHCTRQGTVAQPRSDRPVSSELMQLDYLPATQELTGAAKFKTEVHATMAIIRGKLFEYLIDPSVFWPAWAKVPRSRQTALLTLAAAYAKEHGSDVSRMRHSCSIMLTLYHLRQVSLPSIRQ